MKRIPLLDLGNVVLQFDFAPFMRWLEANSETKDQAKLRSFLASSLFFDFEFGNIDRREFISRAENLFHGKFPPAEFEHAFCDIFLGLMPGMEECIQRLLELGPVYCLSNTNEMHLAYVREKYPILQRFTKIFASHEMHKRKPYPGIFRDVSNALMPAPNELIFFDDVKANVQGAERAGLEAYLFCDAEHLMQMIKKHPAHQEITHD